MRQIVEYFNTIQGEGSTQGMPVTLLRFKFCNLNCSFCDSQDKMNSDIVEFDIDGFKKLLSISRHMMITGGEPTLYYKDIFDISNECVDHFDRAVIETNGLEKQTVIDLVDYFKEIKKEVVISWSPKLLDRGFFELNNDLADVFVKRPEIECKMVYGGAVEFDDEFLQHLEGIGFGKDRVWLMPLGATFDELKENIFNVCNVCNKKGYRLSPRLHILIGKDLDEYLKNGA